MFHLQEPVYSQNEADIFYRKSNRCENHQHGDQSSTWNCGCTNSCTSGSQTATKYKTYIVQVMYYLTCIHTQGFKPASPWCCRGVGARLCASHPPSSVSERFRVRAPSWLHNFLTRWQLATNKGPRFNIYLKIMFNLFSIHGNLWKNSNLVEKYVEEQT